MDRKSFINYLLERGMLVSPNFIEKLSGDFDYSLFCGWLESQNGVYRSLILSGEIILDVYKNSFASELVDNPVNNIDNLDNGVGTQLVSVEKQNQDIKSVDKHNVEIIFSYEENMKKREVGDFVSYFKNRYNSLRRILSSRQELQDSVSIIRLVKKQEREVVSIIGLVLNKEETKNGNIKFVLEDTSGIFNILVTKNKQEIYQIAKDIVLDEVIGIRGVMGKNIVFCNNIYFPEIPITHELKKSPDEVYAVFISDIHFGSKNFLADDFMKFILWLKGEYGSEQQRDVASKVGYLFVVGDVVEGVGIYPGQEDDLEIKDIYKQYEEATRYFKMIPEHIKIIVCGGNHDAIRMSEPQPKFDKNISKGFYDIPNMVLVSNPSFININSSQKFPGFDVLVYHGYSFPYFADNVSSIRDKGGIFRCDLIMKFLLQRRHLAPSHSSTLYVPDNAKDSLVIEKVPDIFVSGHIHQIVATNYRNVTMINSSCWVIQSEDQAKRGIVPHPGKIPIINLKTREVKLMNFLDSDVKVLLSERVS